MYTVRSVGAWGDPDDARHDSADRLGHALAIFGAEATLRCVARVGTVTLYDRDGRELLGYDAERLSVLGGPFLGR
ncbi:MAG: hypothetical protein FJ028_04890 [Chloroflexi bacterium]|nr:hypothetical protein [Chloroflexota bacterium]